MFDETERFANVQTGDNTAYFDIRREQHYPASPIQTRD